MWWCVRVLPVCIVPSLFVWKKYLGALFEGWSESSWWCRGLLSFVHIWCKVWIVSRQRRHQWGQGGKIVMTVWSFVNVSNEWSFKWIVCMESMPNIRTQPPSQNLQRRQRSRLLLLCVIRLPRGKEVGVSERCWDSHPCWHKRKQTARAGRVQSWCWATTLPLDRFLLALSAFRVGVDLSGNSTCSASFRFFSKPLHQA